MLIDSKAFPAKAQISPQSVAASGTASSGWVDVSSAYCVAALCIVGATAATVDFKLEQATTSTGTGVKDLIAGTQFAATDDDKLQQFDCDVMRLDNENGFRYVRLTATVGSAGAALVAGAVILSDPRYLP